VSNEADVIEAKAIWDSANTRREWNRWCAFRKTFDLDTLPVEAWLRISADAQFCVWINGNWIGQGPIRSYPNNYKYHTYSISQYLRVGWNSIAILGHSCGVSTFRYVLGDAFVIAEIECDGRVMAPTNPNWRCFPNPFGEIKDLRMSCQLGWLEPDAFGLGNDWLSADFDDSSWPAAVAVPEPRKLSKAEVQLLSGEALRPSGIVSSSTVAVPATIWTLSLRRVLIPDHLEAGPKEINALVGVLFHVKQTGTIKLELPRDWFWIQPKAKLNGKPMVRVPSGRNPLESAPALEGQVVEGCNELILDVSGHYHEWTFTLSADQAVLDLCSPFYVLPIERPRHSGLFESANLETLRQMGATELSGECAQVRLDSAFVRTAHARPLVPIRSTVDAIEFGTEESQVILDLGRMSVGYWTFEIECDSDTRVIVNGFESIQEGTPDFCWEMSNTFEKEVPAGRRIIRSLQRRGARYLLFQAKSCTIRKIRVIEETLPCRLEGSFHSDSDTMNRINDICVRTLKLCSEDTFVDCPTYEQTYWVGDGRNEALINYSVSGDWNFVRRCWLLAAESLNHGQLVNSQVPSGWHTIIPAWSFLWQVACLEHFEYTGDESFLKAIYPSIRRQTDNALEHINSAGLFEIEAWNLSDWSDMDQPGRGIVAASQGWLVWALRSSAQIAELLGKNYDADSDLKAIDRICHSVNETLWDESRQAFIDCIHFDGTRSEKISVQTQCILSLAGVPYKERQPALDRIITGENTHAVIQPGTPFFLFFVMEYLEKLGDFASIYELIEEKWGLMVENGATTCWELFPGFMPGGRWTRSHCHAWSAGPSYFLSRIALGIVRIGTAHSRILFRPVPNGIQKCSGAVPTVHGNIEIDWSYENGRFRYDLRAPKGCEVEVDLSRV
jgi:hypothetical protein